VETVEAIPLRAIEAARERIRGTAIRTPTIRLNVDDAPAEIFLKLENLQPIGAFKLRGAANRMLSADRAELEQGVWTASAGNMSQGVAWCARLLGIRCAVVVPETAPQTKLDATRRLGARIVSVPLDEWFECFVTHEHPQMEGVFVHAFDDPDVMAGQGTIGLELLEDVPDLDAVVIPYGGGGLACGIASAVRALRPEAKLYASEVDLGAPLAASFAAGAPTRVEYMPSWVDGIGAPMVFDGVYELSRQLLDDSIVVTLEQIADALRLIVARNHVVPEGAGASPVAAALTGAAGGGKIACIVSGGNIDASTLATILAGGMP
jgi:threonine dehydratase